MYAVEPPAQKTLIYRPFSPCLARTARPALGTHPCLAASTTVPVAVVAIRAVVDVPVDAAMVGVGLRLLMTVRACEDRIVVRIRMARGAHPIGSTVIRREPGVVEGGLHPIRRVVAGRAGCRKPCRNVIRIGGAVVIRLVARIAVRRNRRVVVVDVATRAGNRCMRSRQGKRCVVVIER